MELSNTDEARSLIKRYSKTISIEHVIRKVSYGKPHYYVVISRPVKWVYERTGNLLLANDDGIYDTLVISPGTKDAFGGRHFDIPLSDGTVYHATGDVWSSGQSAIPEPTISVGIGSIEKLLQCFVFCSGNISTAKLDAWLAANTPSEDYQGYEKQLRAKYGVSRI